MFAGLTSAALLTEAGAYNADFAPLFLVVGALMVAGWFIGKFRSLMPNM